MRASSTPGNFETPARQGTLVSCYLQYLLLILVSSSPEKSTYLKQTSFIYEHRGAAFAFFDGESRHIRLVHSVGHLFLPVQLLVQADDDMGNFPFDSEENVAG